VGAETISDLAHSSLNAESTRARGLIPGRVIKHPIATVLWRRRRIVGWTVLGALVLACIYILLARRSYISTAQVYVVEGQGSAATDPAHIDNFLNTQCELMTSTPVLALALSQDGINDLETLHGVGDPIDYLRQNIDAEVGKHSELINVSLEVHDKFDAAKLVNAVVQAYITFQTGMQHNTSAQVLDLLLKETAHDLDAIAATNQQLAMLHDQQGQTADGSTQNNPAVQQEPALPESLSAARRNAVNAKSDYDQALAFVGNEPTMLAKIEAPVNSADMVAASPDQLLQMRAEIVQYQQVIQDMERTYLPDHPHVKMARSQLNELTVAYVRALRERWLLAQAHERTIQTPVEHQPKAAPVQLAPVQATPSSDFDHLHAELTRVEKDLETVETRINQVSANQDVGSLSIEITQSAVPASSPSHPAKLRTLGGWLLAGLIIGCGAALGLEKLSPGPRATSQLSVELGAPIVGVLPFMPGTLTVGERALQSHTQPAGAVADASKSIAKNIAESGLDQVGGRALLITSMNPAEGRTTLATNLAVAMAQSGMRVLLVDGNGRSPQLHQIFNVNNNFGLFDILQGRTAKHRVTHRTTVENVDVLTAGTVTGNTVELLNTETLADVLGEFSDQYDRVIVDAPALGRGVEARILAANCAAAILVTTARPTVRRQVGLGLGMLRSVGANVLGLVINETSSTDSREPVVKAPSSVRDPLPEKKVTHIS
jgi:polysaccharide biosynthesis transport protein